jgi:hemerythrin-like domain-containing protein
VIETLRKEHRNLTRLLDALDHQIEVFAEAVRPDYDVILGIAEYFLDYPDRCHHPKENAVFEVLRVRRPDEVPGLSDLMREHRTLHDDAVRFRDVVNALLNDTDIARSTIVGAAGRFIGEQRNHMRMEEAHFFTVAERTLSADDWSEVELRITDARDPLFGDAEEDRFASLRERLLAWEREFRIA